MGAFVSGIAFIPLSQKHGKVRAGDHPIEIKIDLAAEAGFPPRCEECGQVRSVDDTVVRGIRLTAGRCDEVLAEILIHPVDFGWDSVADHRILDGDGFGGR